MRFMLSLLLALLIPSIASSATWPEVWFNTTAEALIAANSGGVTKVRAGRSVFIALPDTVAVDQESPEVYIASENGATICWTSDVKVTPLANAAAGSVQIVWRGEGGKGTVAAMATANTVIGTVTNTLTLAAPCAYNVANGWVILYVSVETDETSYITIRANPE